MAKKHPKIRTIWLDGTKHSDFKDGFSLPDGLPQGLILQKKKLKYRIFTGAFEEELIDEFFEMISQGRGRTATLAQIPRLDTKNVEKDDL